MIIRLKGKKDLRCRAKFRLASLIVKDGSLELESGFHPRPIAMIVAGFFGACIVSLSDAISGPSGERVFFAKSGGRIQIGVDSYKMRLSRRTTFCVAVLVAVLIASLGFWIFSSHGISGNDRGLIVDLAKEISAGRWWAVDQDAQNSDLRFLKSEAEKLKAMQLQKKEADEAAQTEAKGLSDRAVELAADKKWDDAIVAYVRALDVLGDLRPVFYEEMLQGLAKCRGESWKINSPAIFEWQRQVQRMVLSDPFDGLSNLRALKKESQGWDVLYQGNQGVESALSSFDEVAASLGMRGLAKAQALLELEGCKMAVPAFNQLMSYSDIAGEKIMTLARRNLEACAPRK